MWGWGKCTIHNPCSLVSKWIQSPLFSKQLDKSLQSGVWLPPKRAAVIDAELLMHHFLDCAPADQPLHNCWPRANKPRVNEVGAQRGPMRDYSSYNKCNSCTILFICPPRDDDCIACAKGEIEWDGGVNVGLRRHAESIRQLRANIHYCKKMQMYLKIWKEKPGVLLYNLYQFVVMYQILRCQIHIQL